MKIDRRKLESLAKPSHATCYGTGIAGYTPSGVQLCMCVRREIRRRLHALLATGAKVDEGVFVAGLIGPDPAPIEGNEEKAG